MVVILFTVVTQGILVPSSARGSFNTPLLTINNGVFQAIGVISFGAFLKRKESPLPLVLTKKKHLSAIITLCSFMALSKHRQLIALPK
jgi:hypothetical protein